MEKIPDMEEMIESCRKKQRLDEVIVFAIGAGRIIPVPGKSKRMKAALELIKDLPGFVGIHPIDVWHNLLIFDSLNNAKGARNILLSKGATIGQIAPILVPKGDIDHENGS